MKRILIIVFCFIIGGCHVGWELVDASRGKHDGIIEEVYFWQLSDTIRKTFINNNGSSYFGKLNIIDSTNMRIDEFFEVSADYVGPPMRKMGVYFRMNGKKYFIERPVASPIIITSGYVYYTKTYEMRYKPDSIRNNVVFYRWRLPQK